MKYLVLMLALFAGAANADTIGLHVASAHSKSGFNNANLGAYYVHDSGATIGAYCNSESRSPLFPQARPCQVSAYAGYTLTADVGPARLSATVGVITGYARGTTPMALPSLSLAQGINVLGVDIGKPRVAFIPRIDPKRGAHVLHFMWEKEFK